LLSPFVIRLLSNSWNKLIQTIVRLVVGEANEIGRKPEFAKDFTAASADSFDQTDLLYRGTKNAVRSKYRGEYPTQRRKH